MLTIDLSQQSQDVLSDRHLQKVTDVMLKAKKTIVVTGAGISCSSGIPVGQRSLLVCSFFFFFFRSLAAVSYQWLSLCEQGAPLLF
jgi:hypothetical protein